MEQVLEIFRKNGIYFLDTDEGRSSEMTETMIECFEVFTIEAGWLFYRLKSNSEELGLNDSQEHLIRPESDWGKMIGVVKLFEGDGPVEKLYNHTWIEERDYILSESEGTLNSLVREIEEIQFYQDYQDNHNNHNNNTNGQSTNNRTESDSADETNSINDNTNDNDNNTDAYVTTEEPDTDSNSSSSDIDYNMTNPIGNPNIKKTDEGDNFKHGFSSDNTE